MQSFTYSQKISQCIFGTARQANPIRLCYQCYPYFEWLLFSQIWVVPLFIQLSNLFTARWRVIQQHFPRKSHFFWFVFYSNFISVHLGVMLVAAVMLVLVTGWWWWWCSLNDQFYFRSKQWQAVFTLMELQSSRILSLKSVLSPKRVMWDKKKVILI